ncbi:MAG: four helix bundle protein [Prevotella sp.]|nr:four helix bundle protein [Candidatus Equicola faecalis]MDO4819211.1 four helix bundle protein [Prevotella sp.]
MFTKVNVENNIYDLTKDFALRIVNLYKYLKAEKSEYIISKQILRSGTSIGANVHEAQYAQSRADFKSKMNIALKEANETGYWLELLLRSEYICESQYESIHSDFVRIIATLMNIVKHTEIYIS